MFKVGDKVKITSNYWVDSESPQVWQAGDTGEVRVLPSDTQPFYTVYNSAKLPDQGRFYENELKLIEPESGGLNEKDWNDIIRAVSEAPHLGAKRSIELLRKIVKSTD